MTIINHLSMQEYLYGVVPREIGGNSEFEAVKAQAILARTFASRNYNKRMSQGFNLCPTTDDQAYGGYEWEVKNSNKAVDETDGMVATYKGELIGGYYYSTSGGFTEAPENVWGGTYPYLKAVPDPYEPVIEGNTTWEVTLTANEVREKLKKRDIDVGEIKDLVIEETAESGRVIKLKVVGTAGEKVLTKSATRTYLDLKSQWYTINDEAPKVPENSKKTSSGKEEKQDESKEEETKTETKTSKNEEKEEVVIKKETEEKTVINKKDNTSTDIKTENKETKQEDDNKWYLNFETTDNVTIAKRDYGVDTSELKKEETKKSGEELITISSGDADTETIIIDTKERKSFLFDIFNFFINLDKAEKVTTLKKKYEAGSVAKVFVFRGRGWGHGIGMSQNGAKGMAKAGFNAEEILKWYYSEIEIEKY